MKKINKAGLALVMCIVMLILVCGGAAAESGNSLTVLLPDLTSQNGESVRENVTVTLYKAGMLDEVTLEPALDTAFQSLNGGDGTIPNTAEGLHDLALAMADMLDGDSSLSASCKVAEANTDANGAVVFSGLDDALYLVMITNTENYGTVDPAFMISVPLYIGAPDYEPEVNVSMQSVIREGGF